MRKIKSTALLGAFVAVASVGVISHEAHGATTIGGVVTENVSKEMLPNSVTLPAPVLSPGVPIPVNSSSYASITLTLSGATFLNGSNYSYTIIGAPGITSYCSGTESSTGLNSLTLSCTGQSNTYLEPGSSYTIVGGGSPNSLVVYVPQSSSSIVLSYTSDAANDTPASVPLANVMPQLSVSPNSVTTAVISPTSSTLFTYNFPSATNTVVILNNKNNSNWTNTIESNFITSNSSYTISFLFTDIPTSVSALSATDSGGNKLSITTPVNQSATIAFSLSGGNAPFTLSSSSDTLYFSFTNSGNIQIGNIALSSIIGSGTLSSGSTVSYVYSSTTQPFINFQYTGVQIYIPDALANYGGNAIYYSYLTISMPSSTDITSISVLNNPNASCSVPSISNGLLIPEQNTGVYLIDLGQLASHCTGISPGAWQTGVPLVITLSGSNVSPNNVTADAYAVFNGMLKRIPVVVLSSGTGLNAFSY